MKMIDQSHEILSIDASLEALEKAGRTCYKSEKKISPGSADEFVRKMIRRGHHAMIEFGDITVRFITNRGVTHELVRHRLCSFAQESTRYVRYDSGMTFIKPVGFDKWSDEQRLFWISVLSNLENAYKEFIVIWKEQPQMAREMLPNSLKTEIVVKANIREWRHILKLRCSKAAHPQMRALMLPFLADLKKKMSVVFDDINEEE